MASAAAVKTDTDKPAEAKALPPIVALLASEMLMSDGSFRFHRIEVVPKAGTKFEDLLRPEFWGNVSQKMAPGSTIIAYPRDGAWYAELIVWDAGQNWANVSVKHHADRPTFEGVAGVASEFVIGRDPIDGVTVKRRDTGAKVKGNFSNHEDARRWIMDHQKALRR